MSIELILLAVNINLVAFSAFLGDLVGQVFALFVLTVAAAEAEAHRQSAARLDLSSGDWREDAHAFYQSAGFQLNARSFVKRLA